MLNYDNDTQLMTLEDIILQRSAAGNLQEHYGVESACQKSFF